MKKKKKNDKLEMILGISFLLLFLGMMITLMLAGSKIISVGIPIIIFGTFFILISILGKDLDDRKRERRTGKIIFIPLGVIIIVLGISIMCKSIIMFVYSFINIFGIMGLALGISVIDTYIYNKKYCTKKVKAICSKIIDDHNYNNIGGSYYSTTRPVFTISNEDGTKSEELIYDISTLRVFNIGQTYELMINPNKHTEFYISGEKFGKEKMREIILATIFIVSAIMGNYFVTISLLIK